MKLAKMSFVISLLALSSSAFADLTMKDYCFKLPKQLGGDNARIRARFYVEKDKQGFAHLADLLTVEALEGKIFSGSRGDASPESSSDFKITFPSTIHLANEFLLGDMTMVESVKFIAARRVLSNAREAYDLNRMIKNETGIDPEHPVLRVIDTTRDSDSEVRLTVTGSECSK